MSDLVTEEKPQTLVELGGYLGYSAILFADTMRRNSKPEGQPRVLSLEMSANFSAIARELIQLAGLSEIITVVTGPAEESLRKLQKEGTLSSIDFLFLDHVEDLYAPDFKVCEELGFLKKGAVIAADNVVRPGAPEYRAFVRSHPRLQSTGVRGLIQPGDLEVRTLSLSEMGR
jgi:predicted O-methyltransferase YrrM